MAIEALLALDAIEKDLAFIRENIVVNHPLAQELIQQMMRGIRTIDAYLKRDLEVVSAKDPMISIPREMKVVPRETLPSEPVRRKGKADVKPTE